MARRRPALVGGGSAGGLMLAIVAYPAGLAYLTGGGDGLRRWFKAKFLNQTSADPGILGETWPTMTHGTDAAERRLNMTPTVFSRSAAPAGAGTALAFARAQLGEPYQWGGTGPDAWDCSGLTQAAWAAAGVKLPRTSYGQLTAGHRVKRRALAPGDLVWPFPGHVQLYAGGGQVIEAPFTGSNVRVASLGTVWQARRVG